MLEGTNTENINIDYYGSGFILQNDDTTYWESLTFRDLDSRHLFPRASRGAATKHLSMLIEPVHFVTIPESKIITQRGSDVKLQIQFVYKKYPQARFEEDVIKTRIYQNKMVIPKDPKGNDSPYFLSRYTPIFEQGTGFNQWEDDKNPKASVDYAEENIGHDEIQVTINVLIKDIEIGDDSQIFYEIEKTPVKYSMYTELNVVPNTDMYPPGYIGVKMYSLGSYYGGDEDQESPMGLVLGKNELIECIGIGNELSEV